MYGPISTTGRAIMASVRQLEQSGMPRDQAVATARQRLMDNIDPDIEKMMFQVQQLQQQRQQPPQMTIRDQLNQASGINTLPNPDFNPRFAGGGIVAFAGPEGSLVIDEMMPPRMTPGQIDIQRQMQQAAEDRMRYYQGLRNMRLEDFPEMVEDVPESQRVVSRVVDDQGNIWQKTASGRWQIARGAPGSQGFGLGSLGASESPMKRESGAYRAGARDVRGLPPPDVTVDRTSGRVTDRRPGIGAAPAEKPSLLRRGVGALGAAAGIGGVGSLITDLRERAAREKEEAGPVAPVNPYALPGDRFSGYREQRGPIALGAINLDEGAIQNVKDSLSSLMSGATFGLFGNRETEKAQEKKPEAKPEAKPKPIAKPGAAAPATRQPGLFDIPIQIESARAIEAGKKAEKTYETELAEAQRDKTGPYSQRFTEGDRIKSQRLAELKDSKDRSFARGLVAAGLAMAEQASKGGQPGSETQKFFASAVAGLGGYVKAQEVIGTELKKAQKEYDELSFNLETMRDEAQGQLRGKAWEKYKYYQDQAEKARDNAKGLMIVQTQLEQSMKLAGMKTQSAQQVAAMRMQGQLLNEAYKQAAKKPEMMAAEMRVMQAKTPQEKAAAQAEVENLIQREAQMIMSIPSRAAGIQYNTATGDLDFSAADEIANAALGAGG